MKHETPPDLLLVGGGLQAGLVALAVLHQRPGSRITIVERDERLGGNHTWSFHSGDVPQSTEGWLAPLRQWRWGSYDVRFPELYRKYHLEDVRLMLHSFHNARMREGTVHPIIMPATLQTRAATNNMFVSATNSCARRSWPGLLVTPDGRIASRLPQDEPGILMSLIDADRGYYDASAPYRRRAIEGKLHSGESVDDERSRKRSGH